jgi:hypothetical protein
MDGGTISGNEATDHGGGVEAKGTFMMNGGTISGNITTYAGGGVFMDHGASFTMSGGTISGNKAMNGGGVFMWVGTFTMTGGTISGNTASNTGGGAGVDNTATFRIVSGTVWGNETSVQASLRNTAPNGAALYNSGTAQRGTFNGATWNGLGNLSTNNNTIRVVNGALQ